LSGNIQVASGEIWNGKAIVNSITGKKEPGFYLFHLEVREQKTQP
jgi:hypothetical protein